MGRGKKRKVPERSSPSPAQEETIPGNTSMESMVTSLVAEAHKTLKEIADIVNPLKEENKTLHEEIADVKKSVKKLRPLEKQYVKGRGSALTNEFLGFISQIHKSGGFPKQFDKTFTTAKFDKLLGVPVFGTDCSKFVNQQTNPKVKLSIDVCQIFSELCAERNGQVHYEVPEKCLKDILKFKKKHEDLLHKCSEQVQYCITEIAHIAQIFIGPYRLRRLTCQLLARFLVHMGASWENMAELDKTLQNHCTCIDQFKPNNVKRRDFRSRILHLFESSARNGPAWTGFSKDESADFVGIQATFQIGVQSGLFPSKVSHPLEYFVLEHQVA